MPRRRTTPSIPKVTRKKGVKKAVRRTAVEVHFDTAPTTPYLSALLLKTEIPAPVPPPPTSPIAEPTPPAPTLSIAGGGAPSAHLVDLRANTLPRKRENAVSRLTSVNVPRTLSERERPAVAWNKLAVVSFFKFAVWIAGYAALALGKLVALPLIIGLKLTDRHFDFDTLFTENIEKPALQPITNNRQLSPSAPESRSFLNARRAELEQARPRVRPFSFRRALLSFAGTSLAIIIPLQAANTYRSLTTIRTDAVAAGEAGAAVLRIANTGALPNAASLENANAAFGNAREAVDRLGTVGNTLLEHLPGIGDEYHSGKALLGAGEHLTAAAGLLTSAFTLLDDGETDLTIKLKKIEEIVTRAVPELDSAALALQGVTTVPDGVDSHEVERARTATHSLQKTLYSFIQLAPTLRTLLGDTTTRRYLVLFQNNAELRATGGFIGSFALVDVDRGRIKKIEVPAGGPYDLQGSLRAHVLAPEPLRLINAKWEFQDANWFPDFETSARKLAWFYTHSAGPSVDGVIAFNAPLLSHLLDAVGPIGMPEYGVTATAQTVLRTAQEIVESTDSRESGKPKQFIADLLPRLLDKVMTADQPTTLRTLGIFATALKEKDVQFSFADPDAQAAFESRGWTGTIPALPAGWDTVGIVRSNIAGGKTDMVMHTDVQHHAVVSADGTVTDTLTVTLTHTGVKGEPFTGVRNVTYLRAYVPAGSALLSARGDFRAPDHKLFDVPPEGYGPDETLATVSSATYHDLVSGVALNNEFGRTVFGGWLQTDPGTSSTVTFTYTLPTKLNPSARAATWLERIGVHNAPVNEASYGLLVSKQSGAENTELTSTLTLPAGWQVTGMEPTGSATATGWNITLPLTTDRALGAVISN